MNRRSVLVALAGGVAISVPAIAAEPARRSRAAARSGSAGSQQKPGVAERANRRVGRAAESSTAGKVKGKASRADDAMNRLVGRRSR